MPIVPEEHTHRCLAADAHKRLCRMEAESKVYTHRLQPRYPIEFKSQFGEDALLWTLFDGKLDGFFIEAGAFDGYRYSVTYALECVGWNGLLVEGNPIAAKACMKRRRRANVVNGILGREWGASEPFTIVRDHYDGMLSHGGSASDHHKEAVRQGGWPTETAEVPTFTIDCLLEDIGPPPQVDCLVLDVEGAEDHVLAGFDLNRWKPRVMLIEDGTKGDSPEGAARIERLYNQGYACMGFLFVNGIFVRQDDPIFQRAREVVFP